MTNRTDSQSRTTLRRAQLLTPRGALPYLFRPAPSGPGAPLVVFLHGAKDRGDDPSKLLAWGFPKFVAASEGLPYHWLALQIPEGATWPEWGDALFSLVDNLHAEHGAVRITLAGFSLGSAGAWQIAQSQPGRVEGLVIVSGRVPESLTPEALRSLRSIPTWIFHGALDDKAPVSAARNLYDTLREIGTPTRLSVVDRGDHFIADTAYPSPALQRWLASEDKSAFPPGADSDLAAPEPEPKLTLAASA